MYVESRDSERVAMEISGHRTRAVFDRYDIVAESDLREVTARLQARESSSIVLMHLSFATSGVLLFLILYQALT